MNTVARRKTSNLLHTILLVVSLPAIPLGVYEVLSNKAERRLFADALKAADAGRWFWDLRNGAIEWDEQMFQLFGVTGKNPVDYHTFLASIHSDDRERVRYKIEEAIRTRGAYQDIFRVTLPDGTTRSLRAAGMVDPKGRYMTGINLPALHRESVFKTRSALPLSGPRADSYSASEPSAFYGETATDG